MTEKERLMYQIISNICSTDAPIVFKGALITKLILAENRFTDVSRSTVDIDANWTGEPPPMQLLSDIVNDAIEGISTDLYAEILREYEEGKSAGINVIDRNNGKPAFSIDISINKEQESKPYYHGDFIIKGVFPTEILADKISVISGNKIFRRTKDLVDVYALAHCVEVKTSDVYTSHQKNGRVLSDFHAFSYRTDELNHAYQKLRGVENKPDFNKLYEYVSVFIEPFKPSIEVNKIWLPNNMEWNVTVNNKDQKDIYCNQKRTLAEKMEQAKERVRIENANCSIKPRSNSDKTHDNDRE